MSSQLLQTLLNAEATIANDVDVAHLVRQQLHYEIVQLRGSEPPPCHGEDDCSTNILSQCPWRIDCGTQK